MSKTKRRQPTNRERQYERLEREWERQAQAVQPLLEPAIPESDHVVPVPVGVEPIRQEAEALVNARLGDKAAQRVPFSVQAPIDDRTNEIGGGLVWWTGGYIDDYIPLSEYGDPQRQRDIRTFALLAPFILNAESVLTKKVQALQWTMEGGRNLVLKWQERLNNFENGDGWDVFIARWIRAYCESDRAAHAELIRAAPAWAVDSTFHLTPRGKRAMELGHDRTWEIVDARVMDPIACFPTTSREFPLVYQNPYDGVRHRMRPYQFMSLFDMPSIDDRFPGHTVCAVSRAVWAAQEDRMIIRYCMEKMSENPGAGIGVINTSVSALRTALADAKAAREARGVVYYKGVIFLPVLDATGSTKLEFLSFAGLPDGFDRGEVYNIAKEVTATAFGLDIIDLGAIAGRMGTATQTKVMAQRGRTKSIGAIMQGVERQFRYKLLPKSIDFSIKKHDQDEERGRAEIDQIYFENAIRYAQFASPEVAMQYLADKGAVPSEEPYISEDLTPRVSISDVQAPEQVVVEGPEGAAEQEIVKRWEHEGPRIRIDRHGKILRVEPAYQLALKRTQRLQPAVGEILPLSTNIEEQQVESAVSLFDKKRPALTGLLGAR